MVEAVGLTTSQDVWVALERPFSHPSKTREIRLKDRLHLMKKGTISVADYSWAFKPLCDQLMAIGRPVDDVDKSHCQTKYARDIFVRTQLLYCKPVATLIVVAQRISSDVSSFVDVTLHRSLVRALQYLTITRPDITHSVNSVSQYLHAPTNDHFQVVEHIIRYVKGTLHFDLTMTTSSFTGIVAYSNVDWAGCLNTHPSTSCYSIYLGENLVSWSAKKQPTVSRFNCESKYRALGLVAAEIL
ncbi:hypothetical protein F2P56_033007 [Juglans regia]|uniref:Uncharacterized mitochondrial protein AtMg00810-like n=2 Tax=Juglans regia TaxID=51240 RepID=A0A2I4HTE7_JUGRE|nr:uncharacterized mitochondrial protein AtMg00810-like [Juglans regia]KAF5447453.1 hypothetical protein F2P56_033007 [Juglans regia]